MSSLPGGDETVPKKPRMPKSVQPPPRRETNEDHDDDAVIMGDPAPVTKINRKPAKEPEPAKHKAEDTALPAEEREPATRSQMRERRVGTATPAKNKPT